MKKTILSSILLLNTLCFANASFSDSVNDATSVTMKALTYNIFEKNGYLEMLEGYKAPDGKKAMDWIPYDGRLVVTEDFIEVRFKFREKALEFFNQKMKGSDKRMPIGIEIDINPSKKDGMNPLGKVERSDNIPWDTKIIKDTTVGDENPGYGVIISEPQYLKAGEEYYVRFYSTYGKKVLKDEGGDIRLTFQVTTDLERLKVILGESSAVSMFYSSAEVSRLLMGLKGGDEWKYFVVNSNGFNPVPLKNGSSICWSDVYGDDPGCKLKPNNNFVSETNKGEGDGDVSISNVVVSNTSNVPSSNKKSSLPDFKVSKVVFVNGDVKNGITTFNKNEKLKIKAQVVNAGTANSSKDLEVRYYLSKGLKEDRHSEWKKVDSDNIKKENIKSGNTHTETGEFELSKYINNPGKYNVVVCVDRIRNNKNEDGKVEEISESNNCSDEAVFEVVQIDNGVNLQKKPDLIISSVGIEGGKNSIKKGSKFSPEMRIKNIGNGDLASKIRSAYYLMGPSTGGVWSLIDSDESKPDQLRAGDERREEIKKGAKINTKGEYFLKACADYTNLSDESNESNNCTLSAKFTVK